MRDDVFNACMSAKENNEQSFYTRISREYGYVSAEALRSAFRREKKRRGVSNPVKLEEDSSGEEKKSYQETDDNIYIVYANTTLKSKEDVIKEYNIDMTKWRIDLFEIKPSQGYRKDRKVSWHVTDGEVTKGDVEDSGKLLIATLYSLRIKFVPITVQTLTIEAISEYYEKNDFVNKTVFPEFTPSNERVLDINTGDWHIGARQYNKNWSDLEEIFPRMMSDIFYRIENCKPFSKIYFNLMGDIAHFQGRNQVTERHGQYVEGNGMNSLETYDTAVQMCISAIDGLLKHAPVEMLYIPGNHDGDFLYYTLGTLRAYYRDTETFSVDMENTNRKARVFGMNLRGWEHGEMPKKNKVHWLAVEYADLWTNNQYRETFSGHWHHEEVIENGGVKTRTLPAIASTDFWHHRNGYVGAVRSTMSFVWEENRFGWSDIWQSTGRPEK